MAYLSNFASTSGVFTSFLASFFLQDSLESCPVISLRNDTGSISRQRITDHDPPDSRRIPEKEKHGRAASLSSESIPHAAIP